MLGRTLEHLGTHQAFDETLDLAQVRGWLPRVSLSVIGYAVTSICLDLLRAAATLLRTTARRDPVFNRVNLEV